MKPSSSKLPKDPIKIHHIACGAAWDVYAIEWPPKIAICTKCRIALKLVSHDLETKQITYRRI